MIIGVVVVVGDIVIVSSLLSVVAFLMLTLYWKCKLILTAENMSQYETSQVF